MARAAKARVGAPASRSVAGRAFEGRECATLAKVGTTVGYRTVWWLLAVPVVGVQVAALTFTLSRGPWLGAALAIPAFLCLMWFYGTRKGATALAAVVAASVILTFVALSFPTWIRSTSTPTGQGTEQRLDGAVSPGSVGARAATADDEVAQGLSGRIDRWSTSAELAWNRPPVPEGADPGRFVRIFTGYGPDMFRFAFPLRVQAFLREAVAADLHAVELNPMSIDSNLAAAYSAWRVAQLGDIQMALLTLTLYERLAQLTPQNPLVLARLETLRSAVKITPAAP